MMFWDIIAMVVAGFLFAGLAMPIKFFYKKTPKWLIPFMAGLGMMSYQVFSEYQWFANTSSKLPEGSVVVATVPKTTWFRPWSYIKPQIFQFVVLDTKKVVAIDDNIRQAQLYFFERWLPAQTLPVYINCTTGEQQLDGNWHKSEMSRALLDNACKTP